MEREKKWHNRIADRVLGSDTAVLRGDTMATVYGCRRILRYGPARICLLRAHGRVCLCGGELICTAFSAGCVTVEGRIDCMRFCREDCGTCKEEDTQ